MKTVPLLQIDAFTDRPFAGNPAAVCLLDRPAATDWMQHVASEMNLSETAFVHPLDDGFGLRWFTPVVEVELCGHATLAAAHALWEMERVLGDEAIRFSTASGWLAASRQGNLIELDFPATPARESSPPAGWEEAMGLRPQWVGQNKFDRLMIVETEENLRQIQPDYSRLAGMTVRGVIVTSRARDPEYDFVSRYFAPAAGIDEDPVTGSAHCTLGPYWAEKLGKHEMVGYQASARGGTVHVRVDGDRVALGGQAITVMQGELMA